MNEEILKLIDELTFGGGEAHMAILLVVNYVLDFSSEPEYGKQLVKSMLKSIEESNLRGSDLWYVYKDCHEDLHRYYLELTELRKFETLDDYRSLHE